MDSPDALDRILLDLFERFRLNHMKVAVIASHTNVNGTAIPGTKTTVERLRKLFRKLLDDGVRRGDVSPDVSVLEVEVMITGAATRLIDADIRDPALVPYRPDGDALDAPMSRRMAAVDAQTYWMSAKIPNDQFLLFAFDGVPSSIERAVDGLRLRALALVCDELRLRIDDRSALRYPLWVRNRSAGPARPRAAAPAADHTDTCCRVPSRLNPRSGRRSGDTGRTGPR